MKCGDSSHLKAAAFFVIFASSIHFPGMSTIYKLIPILPRFR